MKAKRIFLAVALATLAVCFATPAFAAIGNQGKVLYTTNVARSTNGEITQTGNLYVKNLSTGAIQQVTNYTGTFVIRNPMFSADGSEIIFTSNVLVNSDSSYKVYIVSSSSSNNAGVGVVLQSGTPGLNYSYAALSPDGKTIVFVYSDGSGFDSLWAYDRNNDLYTQVYADETNGITIKHVVFVNATTVAFIGESQGIQNIYATDLMAQATQATTNLTGNTVGNQRYLSLRSGVRAGVDMLIYSKSVKVGTSWNPSDAFVAVRLAPFTEQNVTKTSLAGQNEYEPCFYGDASPSRDVQLKSANGNMFYAAKIIGTNIKLWQANFDTTGASTNTSKTQRTSEGADIGQPDWGPPPVEAPVVTLQDTNVVYTQNDGQSQPQIFIAGFNASNVLLPGVMITNTRTGVKNSPSLRAARVVCDVGATSIIRLNPDGTDVVNFATTATSGLNTFNYIKNPSITPDGKWVVFVAGTAITKKIYAKLLNTDYTVAAINLNVGTNPEDPVVSPDMSSLIWVENNYGQRSIKKIGVVFNAEAGTASTIGSETILGGNGLGLWNDKNPSFSIDGTKIIFVSNRNGSDAIYT
ncbi:MAG: TolB family protein, partial [Candidatus Ratteibacteria bacterium]